MESRLVLNNRSDSADISNYSLTGELQQALKYYKFRRVPSTKGKPVIYLFFRCEEDTYRALRVAKSIHGISLVRYRHRATVPAPPLRPGDIPLSEMRYRPLPPQNIVDAVRYNISKYTDRFATKELFKLFVRRSSDQIVAQRLQISQVHERVSKLLHWWWMNPDYFIGNEQNVQKLLDVLLA